MSAHHSFDRESFQSLLANAFSVQQSGMAPESLSAIVEIQRLIATGGVNADDALHLIADRAREVANATGVAIALLQGNHLVHRAGIGSASKNVGSHLSAVLSASAHDHPRREILRVEDAQTDSRIEAEVCRQFDALALLMLPIYRDYRVVGVLEILFSEPHTFRDPEVRTYQLMATLAGDVTSLPVNLSEAPAEPSTVPHALWRMTSEIQELGLGNEPVSEPAPEPWLDSLHKRSLTTLRDWSAKIQLSELTRSRLSEFTRSRMSEFTTTINRVLQRNSLRKLQWNVGAISLVILLMIAASIARHRSMLTHAADRKPQTENPVLSPAPSVPSEQPVVSASLKPSSGRLARNPGAPSSAFKRVWVGQNEVDYIADDVTIRNFRSRIPTPERQRWNRQVNIGQDVTVRYFTAPPALTPSQPTSISDRSLRE